MVTRGIPQRLLPLLGAHLSARAQSVKPLGVGTGRLDHLGAARRAFCRTPRRQDTSAPSGASEEKVTVHFINRSGECLTATAKEGDSLLDVVMKHNLDIEGFGACEGTLACSTCHLIFNQDVYDQLDSVTDEEMDMLDLSYGLTNTDLIQLRMDNKKTWTTKEEILGRGIPMGYCTQKNSLKILKSMEVHSRRSRLGCQVCLTKAMDGLTVRVPTDVADVRREEVEQKRKQ